MSWLDRTADRLREFAKDRDWEQYHTPKNLAMALSVEVAELLEIYQWAENDSPVTHRLIPGIGLVSSRSIDARPDIADEMADVLIYLIRFADVVGIDLEVAVDQKIEKNARKYPPL